VCYNNARKGGEDMKEAAGEANMTVITIVLIAAVLLIGTVVVNRMMTATERKACCQSIGGVATGNTCSINGGTGVTMDDNWLNANCPE